MAHRISGGALYWAWKWSGPKRAAQAGILWAVERLTTDIVAARLAVRDFRKLRHPAQVPGWAMFQQEGFPFVLSGLSRRLFSSRAHLACLIILYLSSFVWFIELRERRICEDILNAAVSFGLVSIAKRALNPSDLEAALWPLPHCLGLAWRDRH